MPPIIDAFSSHLVVPYAIALSAVVIGVELLSRLDQPLAKRMTIICLSMLLLGWLDFRSLALLLFLSTTIFGMAKARLHISHIIYPLSLLLIGILLFDSGRTGRVHSHDEPTLGLAAPNSSGA